MNEEIERMEKILKKWVHLRDQWITRNLPESKERIVYCSEKIAYYTGYIETLKYLDNLPQT